MEAPKNQIVRTLRELGVAEGANVMVHASLRKLRPEGGAIGLIEALCDTVGEDGHIIMPLGAEPGAPFDYLSTPAEKEIGVLAEVFRTFPRVVVSDHVAGRFAAYGPRAAQLIADPPLHDYLGPGSALERFTAWKGQVVRFGADSNVTTVTHWAEYLARVPNKRRVTRHYERADGVTQEISSLDDSEGIVEYEGEDYFSDLLRDFFASGQARQGKLLSCPVEVFGAQPYVEFAARWMEERLR